jgi:hypothetical protein
MKHRSNQPPGNLQRSGSALLLPALALCSLPSALFAAGLCDNLTQLECKSIASRNVYALLGNNVITQVYGSKPIKQYAITGLDGQLIGLDFRPAQSGASSFNNPRGLHGLTDTGKIYALAFNGTTFVPTLVSSLTLRFDGGFQSLSDFNPVVDALRVIGSNDQNYAVVNSNGNLNVTAQQTAITYAAGDPQAGKDPNLTAGAYNNNIAGAATTIFYGLDYATDSLVTIADVTNGSSATGGGRLKTLGRLLDTQGRPINILPEASIDVYTDATLGNAALIATGQTLYFLNLANVNLNLPIGSTQDVVVKKLAGPDMNPLVFQQTPGVFMDLASTPSPVLNVAADLSVSRTINLASFVDGQPYTFELKITNQGPDSQNGISFGSQFLGFRDPVVATSQGTCTVIPPQAGLEQLGAGFNCNLGTLALGSTATVTVRVSRASGALNPGGEIPQSFTAQGPGGLPLLQPVSADDPDTTNNTLRTSAIVAR